MRKPEKILLSPAEKEALNKIAGKAGCFARSGPTAGQPSFRVLMQVMAEGRFVLYDKLKPREKKKRRARSGIGWWKPFYGNAAGLDWALKASGLDRQGLLDLGMKLHTNPFLKTPDVVVAPIAWGLPAANPSRPYWFWNPRSDNAMVLSEVVSLTGMTADQLAGIGLDADSELDLLIAPDEWKGWGWREENETSPSVDATEMKQ